MTEEPKKRMNQLAETISKERFPMSFHKEERKTAAFISRYSYEAGMNDPGALSGVLKALEALVEDARTLRDSQSIELETFNYAESVLIKLKELQQGGGE